MLQTLRVKNLAIVENIRVEFADGLNVITGETGAGKSIIANALGLVLGERADRGLVRAGEDTCGVEAIFQLAEPSEVDAILEELGIDVCEDGRLIVRRIISGSGGGKNLINDCPATLQALKRVGNLLVDLHGPYDHQSLLSRDFQLDLLDSFGHLWKIRSPYEDIYRKLTELSAARRDLEGNDEQVAQQIDLLRHQVKEIEEAGLQDTDEEQLRQEHATAANATRILELAGAILEALTDSDSAAFNGMVFAQKQLVELAGIFEAAGEWSKEAESITVQIQELCSSVSSAVQGVDSDPERLQWLEDRMALLHKLKRKFGGTREAILAFLEEARERLARLESRGEAIARVETELAAVRAELTKAGDRLGQARRKAAKSLATAIAGHLRDLGFEHGQFGVALEAGEPTPSGLDAIEFGFAPNLGEPMRPLRAIASSGEISRVMLATKAVLAAHDRIPVLVFDEIDTNVGGEMGIAIGEKLAAVAANHQVLCITHLPQVAVHGKHHFVVTKRVQDGRTRTEIGAVAGESRVEEVGRMLGGRHLTSVTLRHARELLAGKG